MRKLLLLSTLAAIAVSASVGGAAQAQPFRPIPPPRVEVIPAPPRPGWVWRPGYWNWYHGGYVWVGGVYVAPGGPGYYPGAHWVGGHWNRFGVWVPAHWVR